MILLYVNIYIYIHINYYYDTDETSSRVAKQDHRQTSKLSRISQILVLRECVQRNLVAP